MPRTDATCEGLRDAPWLRAVVLPLLLFLVTVAVVSALVLSGAVQGQRSPEAPAEAPRTPPTVLIEP